MYDYTLYNDDCILNKKTNTIIYKDDSEWNEYQSWKEKNFLIDTSNKLKRNNTLQWNGGLPIVKNNEKFFYNTEGSLIKHQTNQFINYYDNNLLYKKEIVEDGNILYEECFTKKNKLFKKTDYKKNLIYNYNVSTGIFESFVKIKYINSDIVFEEYYNAQSILIKKKDFLKNTTYIYDDKKGNLLSIQVNRDKLEYIKNYHSNFLQKTLLKKDDIILQEKIYYPSSKNIQSIKKIKNDKYLYKEYFTSGKIRSYGYINKNNKPIDIWKYYYRTGMVESEHEFNNGYLIGNSKLFYENGNLIQTIFHD